MGQQVGTRSKGMQNSWTSEFKEKDFERPSTKENSAPPSRETSSITVREKSLMEEEAFEFQN